MLEKNKDYVEFTLQCTTVEYAKKTNDADVCFNGYSDHDFPGVPMDVVCKDFSHKVVMMSKSDFERLQARADSNAELAKQWEINYNLLLKKIGFDSVIEFINFLVRMGKKEDGSYKTVKEILQEIDPISFEVLLQQEHTIYEWKELTGCSTPEEAKSVIEFGESRYHAYNKIKEKFEQLQTENEQLKKKLEECEKDYISERDKAEALEKEIGIYSRTLNEWKAGTNCPSPSAAKTLIESGMSWYHAYNEIKASNVKLRELEEENADLYAEIRKWKDSTKCETPEAAATWITSYKSACERGNRLAEMVEKLKEEVYSWKNVTGYSTPEDYMHARINCATPFDYTASWQDATGCVTPDQVKSRIEGLENAVRLTNRNLIKEIESNIDEWQKATGCSTPEQAKERIKALNERIDESEADYNHLLCTTGFESEGEIEDALDKCDHSTLRKALVDYEFDYENLLKLTGYKSEHDIRVALNYSEQFVYEDMRELINSLKRKAKFTESGWQVATGRTDPEAAKQYIDRLKGRLNKIHGYSVDW